MGDRPDGPDVRELRSSLELDSGYVSRLLRSLERAGLVAVDAIRRTTASGRRASTRPGLAEWRLLDRRSDDLARSFLEPLPERDRERLVAAMAEVERLLTAALVAFAVVRPRQRLKRRRASTRTSPSSAVASTTASTRRAASRPRSRSCVHRQASSC